MGKYSKKTLFAVAFVMSAQAFATEVLIDFSDLGVAPTLGGTWNVVPTTSTVDLALVDSTGAASGISLSMSITGSNFFEVNNGSSWPAGDKDWIDSDATIDAFGFNGVSSVALTGLDPTALYTIDLLAARSVDVASAVAADYSIDGSFGNSSPNGDNWHARTDGWDNGNYLTWTNIMSDTSGLLEVDVAPLIDNFGYLSAARITSSSPMPEPGTLILLSTAVFGIGLLRRKFSY